MLSGKTHLNTLNQVIFYLSILNWQKYVKGCLPRVNQESGNTYLWDLSILQVVLLHTGLINNSVSASHNNWCIATLLNRIITAQWEGMGDVGSARYEPSLLPQCPTIRVLNYSNCQRSTHSLSKGKFKKFQHFKG